VTEQAAAELLSLPMYPELETAQLRAVAEALREEVIRAGR
jgi:dTDP-4-amino-4,6-dideoxygalactose transaminase